jgi:dolichol-phosphate mannosyltransferase
MALEMSVDAVAAQRTRLRDDAVNPGPRLVVVTPLANEEATIEEFLDRVLAQLSACDRLFCVLDNICKDSTKDRVVARSKVDGRVQLVWAPENRCVVDAYFSGYRAALAANARWILEMDGGLSHIPEQIPRFIEAMESGVDFAAGSRFCEGGQYSGRWTRFMLSKGGTVMANLMLGTRMRDMTSGFECFSHRALSKVVDKGVRSRGHFFQTEIRHQLRDSRWVEVPISYASPSETVSHGTVFESLRNLWLLRCDAKSDRQHQFVTAMDDSHLAVAAGISSDSSH